MTPLTKKSKASFMNKATYWVIHDLSLALKKGNLLIHLKNELINKDS